MVLEDQRGEIGIFELAHIQMNLKIYLFQQIVLKFGNLVEFLVVMIDITTVDG